VTYTLHHGDCLEVMAGMEAGSVDAVVTDPPYGLEFMGKEWDKLIDKRDTRAERGFKNDGAGGRTTDPFLAAKVTYKGGSPAQEWHEAWATEALRVLKPSHYLLAFGGTRTWHRLACALEDAGFEIRDTLMWLYGSGFPKGKACLKPAWEPVILARKPGPMRELGIEECRIGTDAADLALMAARSHPNGTVSGNGGGVTYGFDKPEGFVPSPAGRWPANLVLDEEAAAMLDEQTAGLRGGVSVNRNRDAASDKPASVYGTFKCDTADVTYADSGGASRFFYCAKASRSERNEGCEGMAAAQTTFAAGTGLSRNGDGTPRNQYPTSRNHHPTVKPVALMRWLVRLVARPGDVVLDPFAGSGTTGVACAMEGRDFIGIEREAEYVEIARRRIDAAAAQLRMDVEA